ncbi:MAG: trypsin-like peptidase domain-containing protein [Planctomycetaceae bacterium]|nr:trypsin-like peptidase domain-containing protein [Planctomycetaceae bacterium]
MKSVCRKLRSIRLVLWQAGAVLLLLSAISWEAAGEEIQLKSGQRLVGDILKETTEELYLDVGVDVIRIPLDRIATRQAESDGESIGRSDPNVRAEDVYLTASLPVRSIRELAETYGEGVVLVQTPSGLGSGFIINSRGYCVTNYHVVEQETRIAVTIFHKTQQGDFTRRRIDDVKILALNPFFDLALLHIPEQKDMSFRPVYLSEANEQFEGEEVFAIGNPLGLERSVSQGIVSTRNRTFEGLVYIQTTTQINPGNSGGPLFNRRGEVVGVTNMKISGGEGLGFAIPVAYLKHFLRNRDAFALDQTNPNTGFRYLEPPRRQNPETPPPPP